GAEGTSLLTLHITPWTSHVLRYPHHHPERRQRQADARRRFARGLGVGFAVRFLDVARSAECRIVAVDELAIAARARCAEDVAVARHRRAVEDDQQVRAALSRHALAHERKDALLVIVGIEPTKTFPLMVARVQLGILAIDSIQRPVPRLQLLMVRML